MSDYGLEQIRTILLGPILLSILSGCGNTAHDTAQSTALVLPPVIQYSGETYERLASEAEGGTCPAHVEFGKDYVLTRDKIKLAIGELE